MSSPISSPPPPPTQQRPAPTKKPFIPPLLIRHDARGTADLEILRSQINRPPATTPTATTPSKPS